MHTVNLNRNINYYELRNDAMQTTQIDICILNSILYEKNIKHRMIFEMCSISCELFVVECVVWVWNRHDI